MEIACFTRLARVDELAGPGPFALSADGVDLAVVRTTQGWRAFDGRCPHLGALLGEGELEDGHLVCRNHRWRFDLATGRRVRGPECLNARPIVERGGALYVDVSGPKPQARSPAAREVDDLPGPRPFPMLGNVHQLESRSVHLVLERWAARHGSVYAFRIGGAPIVVISDPDLVNAVFRDRPETFRRPQNLDRVLTEVGIRGVFNAEGDAWRPQRKLTVAALAPRRLRQVYPHVRTVAARMHGRWLRLASEGAVLDVVDELKRFTVDVTMLTAFGHDANTVENSDAGVHGPLSVILPMVGRRMLALLPTWRFVRMPSDRRFDRAMAELRLWLSRLLADARTRAAAGGSSNFLDAMITATDEYGKPFSDEVIISNLFTMVVGGEDTTAISTAWAVHHLADHPQWAQRIRAEADALFGGDLAPADLDAANALCVAGAVANEAMRLRTVAPIIMMEANVDAVVGDVAIPRGTVLALLPRPAALSDENFVDGRAFQPQRWLDAPAGAHDLGAHLPFGSGPRMCPGRSLALAEMNTILALLCKNFDVERVGRSEDVGEVYGFVMSPGGLKVRLRPRP